MVDRECIYFHYILAERGLKNYGFERIHAVFSSETKFDKTQHELMEEGGGMFFISC